MPGVTRARARPGVTGPVGWHVEHVTSTGSTNDDLIAVAAERPDRSVLVADYQHAGRGRRHRAWTAMPGRSLLASILFHRVPPEPMELPRRVGLAAVDACRRFTSRPVALKWPNDVLLDGRKVGGLLAHRTADGSVVVGIGINVGWAPDGAVSLGERIEPIAVLDELLAAYDRLPASPHTLAERYRAELATLGKRVRVELPGGELFGVATDLERDGRLVVTDDAGTVHRLSVGDVVHLRVR